MHLLTRVCLQNWYLIDAIDVEIVGSTALVGPTGAGKSSFADAIQTVLTGANVNRLNLNQSATGVRSARSVLEYCLGMTKDPAEGGKPLRQSCESVLALVFRDEETAEPLTVGIAMSARNGDSREEVLSRFIAPHFAYSVGDAKRRSAEGETLAPWSEIVAHLRRMSPDFEEYKSSAEKFTSDMLRRMRGFDNAPPNAKHFLRAFSNAMAFKPIFDSTSFVREFVLEADPLDIDRVRVSIETWKALESAIEQIEAKLKRVIRLEGRFGTWAKSRLREGETAFLAAQAEMRRASHEYRAARKALASKAEELARTQAALSTRRQWIDEYDEEIRSKRILADAGSAGARLRHIENETRFEERERGARAERYRRIRSALAMIARLSPLSNVVTPKHGRSIAAAAKAIAMMPEAADPADALSGKGETLQALVDEVLSSAGLEDFLTEQADRLAGEVRDMQARAEELESALGRGGSERSVLSSQTARLMAALDRKGMSPVPLCDVVEIVDESWQDALESLLGRGREAIIVPPEHLAGAFDVMWRERDVYAGCTLVKTTATPETPVRPRKGSILEAVRSDNLHAMAFMDVRVGKFTKAESERDLDRIDRGVMRNGKTSSAMGLSVQPTLRERLLGKAARQVTEGALRNELAPLLDRLAGGKARLQMLREAARVLGPAIDALRDGESVFDMEHSSRTARQRLVALEGERRSGGTADSATLLDEIATLEHDRLAHVKEIAEEYQPKADALLRETARAEAKAHHAREAVGRAVAERGRAWKAFVNREHAALVEMTGAAADFGATSVLRRARQTISDAEFERDDIADFLARMRNDNRLIAENTGRDAAREQANAIREIAEYAANWDIDVPKVDPDTMAEGFRWALAERRRLEENELRRHREACLNAANEMRRMLREDLLARLSEKLARVHHRLDVLNRHLARHRFTGQTYSFAWAVNGRFARMYDLAMRVGQSADQDPAAVDGELTEALVELDDLIAGRDAAATLADYRQYFSFEIVMTDHEGGRTTMTSRALRGSGGEAQAPFYVAIAASLSEAYYPGSADGRPKGMGLAMFDEAFNKLDVPNTQGLLNFFRDLGLQTMIAGPEDKRATYTEVVDTIVLVNKSLDGTSVYIDAEHPGLKARRAIEAINPDHVGPEAYRIGKAG
jgi:energy-coupling factor transporter ATP-binding protein EcfA2